MRRLEGNPIVHPRLHPTLGHNIAGPSLIRVPEWVVDPLGQYYLYFADHKGSYIRLAFANELTGPWAVHPPGVLHLADSHFPTEPLPVPETIPEIDLEGFAEEPREGVPAPLESATLPHIASPDVVVRDDLRRVVLYYHGLEAFASQLTRVAISTDGLSFEAREEPLARPYLRAFEYRGTHYAMAMPGVFYRSPTGLNELEEGPTLFPKTMRHAALLVRGDDLLVFWTRVGDAPEHILVSVVDLEPPWQEWQASEPASLLLPEEPWEGGDLPNRASVRDAINVPVRQLRDPAIFEDDDGRLYLLYAVRGESGIAIAELRVRSLGAGN